MPEFSIEEAIGAGLGVCAALVMGVVVWLAICLVAA
jgi:hypothetical protein